MLAKLQTFANRGAKNRVLYYWRLALRYVQKCAIGSTP